MISSFLSSVLSALKFLRPFFRHHIIHFLITVALMIAVALLTASYAYLVKEVLDRIFVEHNQEMLKILPLIVIAITVFKNIALFFQTYITQYVMAKVTINIQSALYKKYIQSDLLYFDSNSTGAMSSKIFQTSAGIADGMNTILVVAVREFLTVIALLAVLFINNPMLTVLSLASLPFTVIPVVTISRKLRKNLNVSQCNMQALTSHVNDSLQFPRLIKSNAAEDFECRRVSMFFEQMLSLRKKMIAMSSMLPSINETISIVGVALVVLYGGHMVINHQLTSGEFFAFFTAMTIAYKPLKSLTRLNFVVQNFLTAVDVIRNELEREDLVRTPENPCNISAIKGDIEFKNVMFKYNKNQERYTIHDVSLSIKSGSMVAIVGPTGSGKSTIISLLERFYDPTSGAISIDGINIKDIDLNFLRRNLSLVSQDVQLFDDTIANNIRYTKVNATDEEVVNAAKMANAHEFIIKMDGQYNSQVGQLGVKLSGGQKQRIAIARAILYNAPIILLDEATSALDSISEKLIQDAIGRFTQGRTTIVIAHRLSTVVNADTILVMNAGQIVESGKHLELMNGDGYYKKLYTTQFANE